MHRYQRSKVNIKCKQGARASSNWGAENPGDRTVLRSPAFVRFSWYSSFGAHGLPPIWALLPPCRGGPSGLLSPSALAPPGYQAGPVLLRVRGLRGHLRRHPHLAPFAFSAQGGSISTAIFYQACSSASSVEVERWLKRWLNHFCPFAVDPRALQRCVGLSGGSVPQPFRS